MAVAVAEGASGAGQEEAAPPNSPTKGAGGGLLSSLWRSSATQTSALVSKVSKSVVRGLGYTESQRSLHGASFHTFVTYITLKWNEIFELFLERRKVPRLTALQRRHGRRVGEHMDHKAAPTAARNTSAATASASATPAAHTTRASDSFAQKVVSATRNEIRRQRTESEMSQDALHESAGADVPRAEDSSDASHSSTPSEHLRSDVAGAHPAREEANEARQQSDSQQHADDAAQTDDAEDDPSDVQSDSEAGEDAPS
jgi:hypothetical protein